MVKGKLRKKMRLVVKVFLIWYAPLLFVNGRHLRSSVSLDGDIPAQKKYRLVRNISGNRDVAL